MGRAGGANGAQRGARRSTTRSAVKRGQECPYLDTVRRQALDFDFEKCCSVSLSPLNVYACLVCGRYYQGRGLATHAFTHALDAGHRLFMKLEGGRVYCLPDNYEVADRSLDDVRAVLDPRFTKEQVCVRTRTRGRARASKSGRAAWWWGTARAVRARPARSDAFFPAVPSRAVNGRPSHSPLLNRSRASTPTSRGCARSTAPSTCRASSASTT